MKKKQSPLQPEPEAPTQPETKDNDLVEQLQRLQAEFDNFRKRLQREHEIHQAQATESMLREILPIIDNLHLALQHAKDEKGDVRGEELLAGITLINDQFTQFLTNHHVMQMETDGKKFDPLHHEALMAQEKEGAQTGTIIQTFQRGYVRHGKPFRPAKVSVVK